MNQFPSTYLHPPRNVRDYQNQVKESMSKLQSIGRNAMLNIPVTNRWQVLEKVWPERTERQPETFREDVQQGIQQQKHEQALLLQETKDQTYLIITASLTLATTLAFNQLAVHVVGLLSKEYRALGQIIYFIGMAALTVFIAVILKVYWVQG